MSIILAISWEIRILNFVKIVQYFLIQESFVRSKFVKVFCVLFVIFGITIEIVLRVRNDFSGYMQYEALTKHIKPVFTKHWSERTSVPQLFIKRVIGELEKEKFPIFTFILNIRDIFKIYQGVKKGILA